ncbi:MULTISPECIES: ABC transporter ATP-binding protein [Bradyrhizobium]|jgi:branched-chain amino acid transport system ATP-binding protein|uniref:Amino acid/amide ABC transporter ATP-binding protein 2, HAAT family n=1 Tax=Bradyrhizobium erythrophlei TaxID=1437360 RepID=A0A1H4VZ92_9BRAD|nr:MULTISPECIES: ABC transporter ATP-binding protein [Bradyrhizobium]QOZ32342.1 ABC transporter ATP-binding protein [Bradyrhizobium sp. CCBAU 53421]SEC85751.1 amino acid/amide ABC transporter ATP-binding protein 2, HAAT family [Bradyrhizobium erythrophlei]
MLHINGLVCRYGKVEALKGVTLSIGQGQLVALIGANGAGKSTTLRAISGILPSAAGRITFDGHDITKCSAREILSKGIAHCPEGRRVFPDMTVDENLDMGAYLRSDRREIAADRERIFGMFPRLAERRHQVAGTLSGGEQQMLAIGRAIMSKPRLMMFDEPSLGLAPNIVEQVFSIIDGIRKSGTTVLMVEQNAYSALEMCDYAYLLETGSIVLSGSGKDLIDDEHVRSAYLGG